MRRPFTTRQAYERGMTPSALKWAVNTGRLQRVGQGVYLDGSDPPTAIERALALVVVTDGVASGTLAGSLHGLDGVMPRAPFVTVPTTAKSSRAGTRCQDLGAEAIVVSKGFRCTNGLQTIIGLAACLGDLQWEQALESALRADLVTVAAIVAALDGLGLTRTPGIRRMRRVLCLRPSGAPPTESLLETLMVQLIRAERRLPEPKRQVKVHNEHDRFVARVDLAWPDAGVFIELDGEHHKDQPLYDASRETAIVATTGWLPGRFTWSEVVYFPTSTTRRLVELISHAPSFRSRF